MRPGEKRQDSDGNDKIPVILAEGAAAQGCRYTYRSLLSLQLGTFLLLHYNARPYGNFTGNKTRSL